MRSSSDRVRLGGSLNIGSQSNPSSPLKSSSAAALSNLPEEVASKVIAALLPRFAALEKAVERLSVRGQEQPSPRQAPQFRSSPPQSPRSSQGYQVGVVAVPAEEIPEAGVPRFGSPSTLQDERSFSFAALSDADKVHAKPVIDRVSDVHAKPVSDVRSPGSDARLPVSDSRSPVSDARSPVSDARSPVSGARSPREVGEKPRSPRRAGLQSVPEVPLDENCARIGPFSFCVNRGTPNFKEAFLNLANDYPDHRSDAMFTYFDTYGGKGLPILPDFSRKVQLLDRALTNDFDNKRTFALKLRNARCEQPYFAPTYFTADEALKATEGQSDVLFYLKASTGTAGKGMRVMTREELRTEGSLPQWHVVQRAITDLSLVEGRKFVVRFFILIHNKEVLSHQRSFAIIHGKPYNPDSTDYDVQINHDTQAAGSEVRCCTLDSLPGGATWHRSIARCMTGVTPALQPLIDASSVNRFILVGVDALIAGNGEAKLIEINLYPNLWDRNEHINSQVKQPMLRDILARILLGAMPTELDFVEDAARTPR